VNPLHLTAGEPMLDVEIEPMSAWVTTIGLDAGVALWIAHASTRYWCMKDASPLLSVYELSSG
jgi:hypothetical protein